MKLTTYHDTRGLDTEPKTFTQVVVEGIAPGGGLYVPDELPAFSLSEILSLSEMPYWQRAAHVFERFGVDVAPERIAALMQQAYGSQWDDERIAPVEEVVPGTWVLELWHGPTSAFKDMALQCMPLFFSEAIEVQRAQGRSADDYLILVATSGDTGKAALDGFADRAHTSIIVFYPAEGVSDIQRKQMVTQHGENVGVFGVRGNFDDCQSAVKAAFADPSFAEMLHAEHGLKLSSANSINWGRLLPQIVYYASAYADMVAGGGVVEGRPIDVCVPTGNFGNILGAYYAKRMGVPIGRLLVASNENNVLADFIATGVYDISDRQFVTTPSPSMDILISSNLERLLFEITRDPARIREWMASLAQTGRFQVDRETFGAIRELFSADYADNDESLETIRNVLADSEYLLDPHTAVAWEIAERLRERDPVLVVSTAHWAKFGTDVYKALAGIPYDEILPDGIRELTGVELLARVTELAPDAYAPKSLTELDDMAERFSVVVDAGRTGVENAVLTWL
ncbi:MAG: threonine synthase [Coriobacteriia bacterium]|nr:threonine synthase [Coriobacteriia bacterium]